MIERIQTLVQLLDAESSLLTGHLAVKKRLQKELESTSQSLVDRQQDIADIQQSAVIIGAVEASQQGELKQKIEKLVSGALCSIFEHPYQFVLKQSARGSQVNTQFCILSPETGSMPIPLKDAHGGGLVVVCAFLLRLIILLSTKPPLSPILFDDEPFAMVSSDHRTRLVAFLQYLSDKSGVRFVFVTHEQELASVGDKVYRFTLVDGLTKVEQDVHTNV